jgi:ferric iron reductase protein FhuF
VSETGRGFSHEGGEPNHVVSTIVDEKLLRYWLGEVKPAWTPYTTVEVGAQDRYGDWIEVGGMAAPALHQAIEDHAAKLGGIDRRIAASSFVFAYVKAMVVPAIAMLITVDTIPDLSAKNARIRFSRSQGPLLWLRSGRAATLAPGSPRGDLIEILVRQALDAHLLPLVDAISSAYVISDRVLRTNVAYVVCTQFGMLELQDDLPDRRVMDALLFHALAGSRFADTGTIMVANASGGAQLRFERSNCCLYRLLEDEDFCDGCSDSRATRRRTRRS